MTFAGHRVRARGLLFLAEFGEQAEKTGIDGKCQARISNR
jgi:hypothetical protein